MKLSKSVFCLKAEVLLLSHCEFLWICILTLLVVGEEESI